MSKILVQRISVAGCDLPQPNAAVKAKFKELGGAATGISDKDVTLVFPTEAAAAEFRAFAEQHDDNAMFRD